MGMAAFEHVAAQKAMKELGGEIRAQGSRYGCHTNEKIGAKLGRCGATVGNWLRDPESIKLGDLRKMVQTLHLDPAIVLAALGYSRTQIRNLGKEKKDDQ